MKYPKPLPNDQIIELLKKWQKDGDLEARNRVVEHNIGLCFDCAHKISNMQDSEDVAMSGVIGLIKACDDFDVSRGLSFGNYAYFRISSECWRFKYTNNSVKIGSKAQIEAMAIKSGKKDMVDVKKKLKGTSESQISTAANPGSMCFSIYTTNNGDDSAEYFQGMPSFDDVERNVYRHEIFSFIESMDEREAECLLRREFNGETSKEVCIDLGVTHQRVDQIKAKALQYIREALKL